MSTLTNNSFIVVIRSAGERTKSVCRDIVLKQLSEKHVKVIQLTPFEEALRESYRIGIKSDKEWLITIDADVLPRKDFLKDIFGLTNKVSDDLFAFKPMIYDKILMKHRLAGFRVYRNKYLEKAFDFIPEDGQEIRPEEFTVKKMENLGHKTKIFEYVAGLHDYEQYYRDIYRKAYFHATKHAEQVAQLMEEWKKKSVDDPDYIVVLKGAVDGLLSGKMPKADLRFFEDSTRKALEELGLEEKKSLDVSNIELKVEEILNSEGPFTKEYTWAGIKKNIKKKGFLDASLYTSGHILEAVGKKLKKRTES
ncbi:hypothetical protein [Rhodohalobacter sulfatireducens]|uniref:Glycosyltransferase 2-like domain-containing protein n=1 Tax=Rhodohalobacter sulfatireducens TaxID=2911366 RepID=A0ABS9KII9_9BACT|nr:hypothetical protein [Rhodohalobacter sulfatireducens]MCG2590667.1 hypothetical protein [Rhodohalobacter sulfatireducens]